MKDAVKRTINSVKLYFRRRKLIKGAMRQWGDNLIMEQNKLLPNITPPAATPATTTIVRTDNGPYISAEPDPALEKSVQELVFAIDQESAAATQAPFTRNTAMMDVINRRIGAN